MSPTPAMPRSVALAPRNQSARPEGNPLVVEAWGQGYMVGSLVILICITVANMRRGSLLHKLILLELVLGIWHGFFIFLSVPLHYAWWLSVSAIFLNAAFSLHNVIAWIKLKPFLTKTGSLAFIVTVILVQPYWVVEIYAYFAFFHNKNDIFLKLRPWDALMRDPWWIFTTAALFYNIRTKYDLKLFEIIRISPRFGVMLSAMIVSIVFIIVDICAVTGAITTSALPTSGHPTGLNPFWKLSFVFKCLTDSVVLDDFKTALDRLHAFKVGHVPNFVNKDPEARGKAADQYERAWNTIADRTRAGSGHMRADMPSPDGELIHPSWRENKARTQHKDSGHELSHFKDNEHRRGSDAASDDSGFPTVIRPAVQRGSYGQVASPQSSYFPPRRSEAAIMQDEYAMAMRDIGGDSARDSTQESTRSFKHDSRSLKSFGKRRSDGSSTAVNSAGT